MSAEEWQKRFSEAIKKGREAPADSYVRKNAIDEMKALGITDGDAEYWLHRKPH